MHSDRTLKNEDRTKLIYELAMCKHLFSHEQYIESQQRLDALSKFASFLPHGHKYLIQIATLQYQIHMANGSYTAAALLFEGLLNESEISYGKNSPSYHRIQLQYLAYLIQYGSDYKRGERLEKISYKQFAEKELYHSSKEMIQIQMYLAQLCQIQNRYVDAENYTNATVKEAEDTYGLSSLQYTESKINVCNLLVERGDFKSVYDVYLL
jgi:hypothetical protein